MSTMNKASPAHLLPDVDNQRRGARQGLPARAEFSDAGVFAPMLSRTALSNVNVFGRIASDPIVSATASLP